MSDDNGQKSSDSLNWILFAGLGGVAITTAVQLTSIDPEKATVFSTASSFFFAVAVPMLAANLAAEKFRWQLPPRRPTRFRTIFGSVAIGTTVLGLGAAFAHIHFGAGIVFIVTVIASCVALRRL